MTAVTIITVSVNKISHWLEAERPYGIYSHSSEEALKWIVSQMT
jgi:hypothetical protein